MNASDVTDQLLLRRLQQLMPAYPMAPGSIATNISFGAAVLGAQHVELKDHDGWWFVASEFDWLTPTDASYDAPHDLFTRLVPFPQQAPDSHRAETYILTCADIAYMITGAGLQTVRGEIPEPLPHVNVVPAWCSYVLAYRVAGADYQPPAIAPGSDT